MRVAGGGEFAGVVEEAIGTEGEAGSDLISGCDSVDEAGEAGEGSRGKGDCRGGCEWKWQWRRVRHGHGWR